MKQYAASNEGVLQNQREHHKILIKYVAVHPTAVPENYSSSGMLTILIKAQISILSNISKIDYISIHSVLISKIDNLSIHSFLRWQISTRLAWMGNQRVYVSFSMTTVL